MNFSFCPLLCNAKGKKLSFFKYNKERIFVNQILHLVKKKNEISICFTNFMFGIKLPILYALDKTKFTITYLFLVGCAGYLLKKIKYFFVLLGFKK